MCPRAQAALERPLCPGALTFGGSQRRKEAFTRADRSADTVDEAATRLRRVQEVALPADTQASLVEAVLAAARPQDIPLLLAPRTHTVGSAHDAGAHARALLRLDTLGRDLGLQPTQDLRPALAPLLAGTNLAIRAAAARLVGRWQVAALEADLVRLVEAADTEEPVRAGAILGLALFPAPEHTGRILRAAGPGAGPALKTAAAAALPPRDPDASARLAAEVLARETDTASIEAVAAPILRQPRGRPRWPGRCRPPHPIPHRPGRWRPSWRRPAGTSRSWSRCWDPPSAGPPPDRPSRSG